MLKNIVHSAEQRRSARRNREVARLRAVDFIMTELEVSLSFVQSADSNEALGNEIKAQRHRSIAEQGLEVAHKYASRTKLSAEQKHKLLERINLIELLLRK
jgi:hypothetical protein